MPDPVGASMIIPVPQIMLPCRGGPALHCADAARWNGYVDEELRRELLHRRDEDQRIRTLVSPPKGQYTARLPDAVAAEWGVPLTDLSPAPNGVRLRRCFAFELGGVGVG
jgi:hypothetical protein